MTIYEVVRRPIVTEKGLTKKESEATLCFEVHTEANKIHIKAAVEKLFNVKVTAVNTMITKGKKKQFKGRPGQRSDVKKAIVTLESGATIDVTTGL